MAFLRTAILSLIAILYSSWASALGMGELTLNSALHEPLDAEVALLNVKDLSSVELLVRLASKEDFELANVQREYHLLDLKFSVDLSDPDHPFIKASSGKPIREPYLDFLISIEWPAGSLLREYTIFLDPPTFAPGLSSGKADTRAPTVSSTKKKNKVNTPVPQSESASKPGPGAIYRVRSGDTLWGIASENRPSGSSLQQTMQAIFERNDSAFVAGNMNRLKKGAMLELPGLATIESLDQRAAAQLVAESAQDLKPAPDLLAQDNENSGSPSGAETNADGVLRLVSPGNSDENPDAGFTGAQSGSQPGGLGNIESGGVSGASGSELAQAQEEIAKSTRENTELRERLAQLEEQLSTMSRLVELGDNQLSDIQRGLAQDELKVAEEISAEGTAGLTDAEMTAAPDAELDTEQAEMVQSLLAGDGNTEGSAEGSAEENAEAKAEGENLAGAAPIETKIATPSRGILGWIRANLSIVAAGLLALILGVLFLLARRRSGEGAGGGINFDAAPLAQHAAATRTSPEDQGSESPVSAKPALYATNTEQVDPVEEADGYMSFGEYGEAENILREALRGRPRESSLHLKLLELFSRQGDNTRFDEHLPILVALGDREATENAEQLRSLLVLGGSTDSSAAQADLEIQEADIFASQSGLDVIEVPEQTNEQFGELELMEDPVTDHSTENETKVSYSLDDEAKSLGELELDLDFSEDLEIRAGDDDVDAQLEMAQAYLDLDDANSAREILNDICVNGNAEQQARAQEMLNLIP